MSRPGPAPVVVLAGGRGTRLRGRVDGVPKPMAPVAGRPFLEHLLGAVAEQGVRRVLLSVGYLAEVVIDHVGDSFAEMSVEYVVEAEPLGTGGAIRAAAERAGSECVVVLNGDTVVPLDLPVLEHAARGHRSGLAMTTCRVDDVARFGGLDVDGETVVGLQEKGRVGPGLINAGVYALAGPVLTRLAEMPERFSFESDLLTPWIAAYGAAQVRSPGPFLDIGVPDDYDRAASVLNHRVGSGAGRSGRPPG